MPEPKIEFFARKGEKLAYIYQRGQADKPGLVFLTGFLSNMIGTKAEFLSDYAARRQLSYLRFDYFGHGQSSGDFLQGTVSHWRAEMLDMLAELTDGPQILIGSSFGGWLALMAALEKQISCAGLVLLAPAVDMTEKLMWQKFDEATRTKLKQEGVIYFPSDYDNENYPITYRLIEDGKRHLMLDKGIAYDGPVRILHGQDDKDVPWQLSLTLAEKIHSMDVELYLIKAANHRLSAPENLRCLQDILDRLIDANP